MSARHALRKVSTDAETIPGRSLIAVEFAELGLRQGLLNDPTQLLVVHRSAHPPSHSGSEMFERHDLETVTPFPSGAESKLAGGHAAVGYDRSSVLGHRVSLPGAPPGAAVAEMEFARHLAPLGRVPVRLLGLRKHM